ncbi:hypothetical protein NBRC116584_06720 [Hydrogenophaga sp. 5NK40-0174]
MPANFDAIKEGWAGEVGALQSALRGATATQRDLTRAVQDDPSLAPQATAAALEELKAAKAYNDFLDKDKEYWAKGDQYDQQLKNGAGYDRRTGTVRELPGYDRLALEHSRDKNWALAGEFQMFKTEHGLKHVHLAPVNTPTETHHVDGAVERRETVQGHVHSAKEWAKEFAGDYVDTAADIVKNGPLTPEQNRLLCKSTVGAVLGLAGAKMMPAPGGGPGATVFDDAVGNAINASDPASTICDPIYRGRRKVDVHGAATAEDSPALAAAPGEFGSFGNLDTWLDQTLAAASMPGQEAQFDRLMQAAANDPAGHALLSEAVQAEDQREMSAHQRALTPAAAEHGNDYSHGALSLG